MFVLDAAPHRFTHHVVDVDGVHISDRGGKDLDINGVSDDEAASQRRLDVEVALVERGVHRGLQSEAGLPVCRQSGSRRHKLKIKRVDKT